MEPRGKLLAFIAVCSIVALFAFSGKSFAPSICGNGNLDQAWEECEVGVPCADPEATCDESTCLCTPPEEPVCGDGVINQAGEECEVGVPCADPEATCDESTCLCTPPEPPADCWLTAGGVKFESITGTRMATEGQGPKDTVGGVAYPSCSPFPSNGGQWNHVAHSLALHLLGRDITVIRCGNVEGIEPGSESPVCGVNFIEFEGTGVLKGIHGNHMEDVPVSFFVRAEDRNEPGNEQAVNSNDGDNIDRYFLRVVDGDGTVRILVDEDGNPDTVDPITITGGNFQIHCTSCD